MIFERNTEVEQSSKGIPTLRIKRYFLTLMFVGFWENHPFKGNGGNPFLTSSELD